MISKKFQPILWLIAFNTINMIIPSLSEAQSLRLLENDELDDIVAGENDEPLDRYTISEQLQTPQGHHIQVEGDISLTEQENHSDIQFSLNDSAQQNLQSFININAVNSPINVLMNLNISIDSEIQNLDQLTTFPMP